MAQRVVILGGGTGGTLVANRLRRALPPERLQITVVDRDDRHLYQPGLLFVPFGAVHPHRLVRPRHQQFRHGVLLVRASVDRVDVTANRVLLDGGSALDYDLLVVATGAEPDFAETEGLTGPGWGERVFSFYDPPSAAVLRDALAAFDGGHLAVAVAGLPIKCPVAPLEFCFLADAEFRRRRVRERVRLSYLTPLDAAFTKPVAARRLSGLLDDKGIDLQTGFDVAQVDGAAGRITAYDGRAVDFDLAVVIPAHSGPAYVGRSPGLGDELGFVPVDPHTLQAKVAPNVFALGDAAAVSASKAGSVAHFEGEVVVANICSQHAGEPLTARYDGHTNCFVETGDGRALLIDFNDDTEPLPGHYPGRIGLPLLAESRANHLGKRAFEWLYWHALLPGRDLPGIGSAMPTAGKVSAPAGASRRGEE